MARFRNATHSPVEMHGHAGYIAHRANTITRDYNEAFIAADQGIDVGQDKYAVVCNAHATILGCATRKQATEVLAHSTVWCEECRTTPVGTIEVFYQEHGLTYDGNAQYSCTGCGWTCSGGHVVVGVDFRKKHRAGLNERLVANGHTPLKEVA